MKRPNPLFVVGLVAFAFWLAWLYSEKLKQDSFGKDAKKCPIHHSVMGMDSRGRVGDGDLTSGGDSSSTLQHEGLVARDHPCNPGPDFKWAWVCFECTATFHGHEHDGTGVPVHAPYRQMAGLWCSLHDRKLIPFARAERLLGPKDPFYEAAIREFPNCGRGGTGEFELEVRGTNAIWTSVCPECDEEYIRYTMAALRYPGPDPEEE
jgi:hypothetical protein